MDQLEFNPFGELTYFRTQRSCICKLAGGCGVSKKYQIEKLRSNK